MEKQLWKLKDVTIYEPTGDPKREGNYQFKLLDGITVQQEFGQIIGIIGDKDSGMEAFVKILQKKLKPSKGSVSGYDGPVVTISLEAARSELTGENIAQQFYQSQGYSKKKSVKLVNQCEEFSELGEQFYQKISQYTLEERAQLELSMKLQGTARVLIIDDCLTFVKTRFLLKVLVKLDELKLSGGSGWLFNPSVEKMMPYCDQLLWLEFGRLREVGTCESVVRSYQNYLVALQQMTIEQQQAYIEEGLASQVERKVESLEETNKTRRTRKPTESRTVGKRQERHRQPLVNGKTWKIGAIVGGVASLILTMIVVYSLVDKEVSKKTTVDRPVVLVRTIDTSSSQTKQLDTSTEVQSSMGETVASSHSLPETSSATKLEKAAFNHAIKQGETLEAIAQLYGVTIRDLMAVNDLTGEAIYAGATLALPVTAVKKETTTTSQDAVERPVTPDPPVQPVEEVTVNNVNYTVEQGDTLYRVASSFGVDVMAIQRENHLQTPDLYPGQVLVIPK